MAKGLVQNVSRSRALSYKRYALNESVRANRKARGAKSASGKSSHWHTSPKDSRTLVRFDPELGWLRKAKKSAKKSAGKGRKRFLANPIGVTAIAAVNGRRRGRLARHKRSVIGRRHHDGSRWVTTPKRGTRDIWDVHHSMWAKSKRHARVLHNGKRSKTTKLTLKKGQTASTRDGRITVRKTAMGELVTVRPRVVKKRGKTKTRTKYVGVPVYVRRRRRHAKGVSRKGLTKKQKRKLNRLEHREASIRASGRKVARRAAPKRSRKAAPSRGRKHHASRRSSRAGRIEAVPVFGVGGGRVVVVREARANAKKESGMYAGAEPNRGKKKGKRKLTGAALKAHQARMAKGGKYAKAGKGKYAKKGARKGKYKLRTPSTVWAQIGHQKVKTFLMKAKGGKLKHIPRHTLLGFKSEKALQAVLQGSDDKKAEALGKRLTAIYKKRKAAAEKLLKHGDAFTPNRASAAKNRARKNAEKTVSYEEWSDMTPNKRGRKGKKKSRKSARKGSGLSKKARRAAARKASVTRKSRHSKRSRAAKKGWKSRSRKAGKRKVSRKSSRRVSAKRGSRKSSRKSRKVSSRGRKSSYKKRGASKRRAGGKSRKRSMAGKKVWAKKTKAQKRAAIAALRGGKRGSSRKGSRRASAKRGSRRGFRRNGSRKFTANAFLASLKEALAVGAVATGGFLVHRGLSWVLSEKLFSTIAVFSDGLATATAPATAPGSMAPYRKIVAAAIVAAIGIPVAEKVGKKHSTALVSGVVVSFLHQALLTILGQVQPTGDLVKAFAGYGDREGRAFKTFRGGIGEYFMTGQNGMGEYYMTGQNGFGAFAPRGTVYKGGKAARPMLSQAAAGFRGFGGNPMVTQAAAGFGGHGITQAAAGFGGPPRLTQAAAGVGEYFLTQAHGIGDYEMVTPPSTGAETVIDEGIVGGDLHAAERALSIGEAVSGVSGDDVGVQSIVDPTDVAVPVNDEPGGTRAGILAGGDGIFG